KTIVDGVLEGTVQIADTVAPTTSPFYNPSVKKYPYDPAAAKKLLDDAGWKAGADGIREKNGEKLTLTALLSSADAIGKLYWQVIQQNMKAAGVDIQIDTKDAATRSQVWRSGQWEIEISRWVLPADPSVTGLYSFKGANNMTGFCDASMPLLSGISFRIFLTIQAAPGGPEAICLENRLFIDPQVIEAFRQRLGLDQPVPVQYVRWLGAVLSGDFGISFSTGRPVGEMILERLPATLELMSISFVLAAVVAIPLGVYSAVKQYSLFDFSATTASFLGIAMPVFWFALILQLVFSVQLGWLPTSGRDTIGDGSLFDQLKHLVLPAFVLSIRHIAGWSRYMRSSLLDVIRADFIRTARSKGLRERIVLTRHAVKNALIPVISIMALDL